MSCSVGTILIVEDCDEDFETVLEAARPLGLASRIHRARTGGESLVLLQEWNRTGKVTALVLMDLHNSEEDGLESLRRIKDGNLRSLPVVIFSTAATARDPYDCYALGANAYHAKSVAYPAHLNTLRQIFDYWLAAALPPTPLPSCLKPLGTS